MAAKTTIKVATLTSAAKDDNFQFNEDGGLIGNFNVLANDPGSASLYSVWQGTGAGTAQFTVQNSATLASGAVITMNGDGTIKYDGTALERKAQSLTSGESFTDVFSYTVRMANGALSTAQVTVTFVGEDDAATFAGDDAKAMGENDASVAGTLEVSDLDHDQSSMQEETIQGNYGKLAMQTDGNWTYTLDSAQDQLAEDEQLTDIIKVKSLDGTEHDITVTIVGENDAATFAGDDAKSMDENDASVVGKLEVSDLDHGQSYMHEETVQGTYGKLAMQADGNWTYTLDSAQDQLAQDKSLNDVITVKSLDGTEHDITVTINGSNDAATISGNATGAVTEDGTLVTSGQLTASDLDHDQGAFAEVDAADLAGVYGDFTFDSATGEWGYQLRNGDANVQVLGANDHPTETLTVWSLDRSASQTITVAVNGADEPAPPVPSYTLPTTIAQGTTGPATLSGTSGDDKGGSKLQGADGNDVISGLAGNDQLLGGKGSDTLLGGDGNDSLAGQAGSDTLLGGSGSDSLEGGDGSDYLDGGSGGDQLLGGTGADALYGSSGADTFRYTNINDGVDVIYDFEKNIDNIDISALYGTGATFQITAVDTNGNNTADSSLVSVTSGGSQHDMVIVVGVPDLSSSDIVWHA